jgi:hypothetical protein
MNLANVDHRSLTTQLGKEIPEVMVIVAKHRVAGLSTESLAELIGCDVAEIESLEADPIYQEVRGVIGALVAAQGADQGFIWDSIEDTAARRLLERIAKETDPEFLLRAAATANKMTRRNQDRSLGNVLEPGLAGRKVAVVLSKRMVERLTGDGTRTVATEQKLSIHDGSMSNPGFDEVNELLGLVPTRIAAPADASLLTDMGFEEAA